jgi:signal transduction histidine kinase
MINPFSDPFYLLSPLVALLVELVLVVVVWRWTRPGAAKNLFIAVIGSLCLWSFLVFMMRSSPDVGSALPWQKSVTVVSGAAFMFYYHFTLVYTKAKGQRVLLIAAYVFLAVMAVLAYPTDLIVEYTRLESYGYAPEVGRLGPLVFAIVPLVMVMGAFNLLRRFRQSKSYDERNRILYLLVAIIISFIGVLLDAFSDLPPAAIWSNLLFCVVCSVAIVKYQLLDINVVIRKSIIYFFLSAVVAVPYVGLLYLVQFYWQAPLQSSWIYGVLTILVLAIVLRPLYSLAQTWVDKLFYRDRYDHLKALRSFSLEASSIVNPGELGTNLVNLVAQALRSPVVCLLLRSEHRDDFTVASCHGLDTPPTGPVIRARNALVKYLTNLDRILKFNEFDVIPQLQALAAEDRANLEKLQVELFVPIITRDGDLSAVLTLSPKSGQQLYSQEDIQTLNTLSKQMAVQLENIRLYRESLEARGNLEVWLNSMMDYVIIVDAGGFIQFMNRAAVTQFGDRAGSSYADALGRTMECFDLHYLDVNGLANMQCLEVIGSREFEVAAARLLNPDGTQSLIGVLRDVTERRYIEEERLKSSKLESISTLAGGIAHDFNNILTGILGNASLIKSNMTQQDESYTLADEVEKASNRARALTQQLLTFARGSTPLKRIVDITGLIEESVPFALRGSKARYHIDLGRGLWSVNVDEGQISQVLNNILINADQAMPTGGNITISATNLSLKAKQVLPLPAGDYVRIRVSDEGIGIPSQYTDKIFDPYFTTKAQGTGLGLATTYSIIKNHEGNVSLRSTPGEGSTFDIYLPAASWDAAPAAAGETGAGIFSGHVLVMDDEEMVQRTVLRMLERIGFRSEVAADGAEAVRMYRESREAGDPFDLLIMDLTVPGGMGGREAMEQLLKYDPDVKAVVSSGYSNDQVMSRYRDFGFIGMVTKPYTLEELRRVLGNIE